MEVKPATTTASSRRPAIMSETSGGFVVVWDTNLADGSYSGVFGRRYDGSGVAQGDEFRVNTYTTNRQNVGAVASQPDGGFVVVWDSLLQDGSGGGTFARRYDGSGTPLGDEFRVNTYTTGTQQISAITSDAAGNFVVVWHSVGQDGSGGGIFGQRFDASGAQVGGEFQVNTYTPGPQYVPRPWRSPRTAASWSPGTTTAVTTATATASSPRSSRRTWCSGTASSRRQHRPGIQTQSTSTSVRSSAGA